MVPLIGTPVMGDMNDFIHKISEKAGFEPTTSTMSWGMHTTTVHPNSA